MKKIMIFRKSRIKKKETSFLAISTEEFLLLLQNKGKRTILPIC